ncbi:hypothetical protein D3C81_2273610 [compost metagenome]
MPARSATPLTNTSTPVFGAEVAAGTEGAVSVGADVDGAGSTTVTLAAELVTDAVFSPVLLLSVLVTTT